MRHVIGTELKNSIWNLRFFGGVLLIVLAAVVSELTHLKFLLDSGGNTEGPGWFVAYSFLINGINALLFIPIAVSLAAGGETEMELRSRFSLLSYIRSGKTQYLVGKVAGLILSGGLMACLAMLLFLGIGCIGFGDLPMLKEGGMALSYFISKVLISFVRGFLNGALWATIGGFAAVVTRSRYLAYAVPFILYYVMSVFQERYYQKLFFLNPRYWMAPVYYSDLFCIVVLLTLCILISLLFMWAVKRRLDYA